ncbi:MAG: tetratricopeptide repeat protein [Bacteroidota bacterium]
MKKNNSKYNQQSKSIINESSLNNKKAKSRTIFYILIAFLLPVLLYIQTVNYKFTNFDDDDIIVKNIKFLSDIKNAHSVFLTDAFINKSSSFYRPLQTLTYMIDIQLSGVNETWMFHLTNILLLALISCSLFILLRRLFIPPTLALLATLIYCLHPLFVSSIAWIPARGDLLLTLFSLLSFLFIIQFLQKGKAIYLFLNWAAFTIALFCKETAIVLPLIFIIYYFTSTQKIKFNKFHFLNILLYALSGIFWFLLRSKAIGGISNSKDVVSFMSILINLRTIPEALIKFFIPSDIAPIPFYSILKTIVGLLIIGLLIFISFKKSERSRKEKVFCFSWFLFFMLPPMLFKHNYIDYLDHRFFLPLIGILFFVLFSLPKKWFEKGTVISTSIMLVILISLSSFTIIKSSFYKDPMTFYSTAISHNSYSVLPYYNRGNLKYDKNNYQEAIEDYNMAIAIMPNYSMAYLNRGISKLFTGDNPGAITDLDSVIILNKETPEAYYNRGVAYMNMGNYQHALKDYSNAIAYNPNYEQAYCNRGSVKLNLGDKPGALADFNKIIEINPNYPSNFCNRALVRFNLNDLNGAIEDCDKALKLNPNFDDALKLKAQIQQELRKKK